MKTYKIWIYVEEYDEEDGTGNDVVGPELVEEFPTLAEAEDYVMNNIFR